MENCSPTSGMRSPSSPSTPTSSPQGSSSSSREDIAHSENIGGRDSFNYINHAHNEPTSPTPFGIPRAVFRSGKQRSDYCLHSLVSVLLLLLRTRTFSLSTAVLHWLHTRILLKWTPMSVSVSISGPWEDWLLGYVLFKWSCHAPMLIYAI